jgi:homoserine O-acetyltransferase
VGGRLPGVAWVSAIPIATTTRHSAQQIAFNEVGRQAIMADPDWNDGNYYDKQPPARGLAVARMVGHITYMSDDSMREKFGRRLRGKENFSFGFDVDFEVESYLRYRGSQFVYRFDANSYLYITKAMDYFDLTNGQGTLAAGAGKDAGPLPGDQLQLGLALPQLSIPGTGARPALAQSRRGLRGAAIQLRARFLPGGRGGADRPGARLPGQHVREGAMKAGFVRELLGRSDYAIIGEIVEPGTKVLDLGCGEGELLEWLAANKGVDARGVEISGAKVQKAIARGVSVFQCDIDEGLADYPDQAFDYVILSQTLQETRHPRRCCARCCAWAGGRSWRFPISATGGCGCPCSSAGARRAPKLFPYEWYESPNIHFLTVHDFEALAALESLVVERRYFLAGHRKVDWQPNLMAEVAVFLVCARSRTKGSSHMQGRSVGAATVRLHDDLNILIQRHEKA